MLDDFALDTIFQPIPGNNPAGADPRTDVSPNSLYFRLRDARAEARDLERQSEASGSDDGAPPLPWRTVRSLAEKGLRESAKDLELATWLTEALVRGAGLRGLETGALVIGGLIDRFWDGLYPMPDEDGIETRVGPLGGLSGQGVDGTLMQPLRKISLFPRPDGSPFGFWQYELSIELSGITDPDRRRQRQEAGVVTFEDVEKEARLAGAKHWVAMQSEINAASEAWDAMTATLDAHAESYSPSTLRVKTLLAAMAEAVARFAPAAGAAATEPQGSAVPATAQEAVRSGPAASAPVGGLATRDDALRQLSEIAAWFKRNEPNSPLAYTLDDAVRRGRMSWPELVSELLPDETARNSLLISLGIKPAVPDEG